jgi:phosphoenolpyruvate carboxylase
MLGEQLGRVIEDYGGAGLLKDVEMLRRSVIRARDADVHERKTEAIVASWPLERAEEVARAFTVYFHLVNLAEEHHRARVLRERDARGPQPESLAATVAELQLKHGRRRLMEMLSCLEIHPVFTAHPTEARRRAIVTAIRRVGEQLNRLEDPRSSEAERRESMRRLTEEIDSLWRTGQLRSSQVTPLDEVRSIMAVFDETLFRVVPEIYRSLDWALGPSDAGMRPPLAPAFLRFGSWVGGDRDGNQSVTAAVTAQTIASDAQSLSMPPPLLRAQASGAGWLRCAPKRQTSGRRSKSARRPSHTASSSSTLPSAFAPHARGRARPTRRRPTS